MSNYKKGAMAEYRLKHKLEEQGWQVVRSAGSHGKYDLIAFRTNNETGTFDILLIQVKKTQPPKKPKIIAVQLPCRVLEAYVFVRNGYFLSRQEKFSIVDPFEVFRRSEVSARRSACSRRQRKPRCDRRDDRSGSKRTRHEAACSR